jgi:hypothetical protein
MFLRIIDNQINSLIHTYPLQIYSNLTGMGVTTILKRMDRNRSAELLCAPPDARNRCATLQIAYRDIVSSSGMMELEKPV